MNEHKMNTILDHERLFHFAKATLLAGVATLLLVFQQTRHSFHETREAFVAHQRQRTRDKKLSVNVKKGKKAKKAAKEDNEDDGTFVVGFFHPRCSSGGGGERVLWKSIQALGELKEGKFMKRRTKTRKENSSNNLARLIGNSGDVRLKNCKNLSVVVYTVDEPSDNYDKVVFEKVRERFSIVLPSSLNVHFVHLNEVKNLLSKYQILFEEMLPLFLLDKSCVTLLY